MASAAVCRMEWKPIPETSSEWGCRGQSAAETIAKHCAVPVTLLELLLEHVLGGFRTALRDEGAPHQFQRALSGYQYVPDDGPLGSLLCQGPQNGLSWGLLKLPLCLGMACLDRISEGEMFGRRGGSVGAKGEKVFFARGASFRAKRI